MKDFYKVKKTCNFYVSTVHLSTMLVPYIHKKINLKNNIITFLQYDLQDNIDELLSKIILNENEKEKIRKINWKSLNLYKYSSIEKNAKKILENNNEVIILVVGDEKRINFVEESLNKFLEKNSKKINKKNITLINCYEVIEFNNNIVEILSNNEYILNTSGEYKVEEYFDLNKKAKASID